MSRPLRLDPRAERVLVLLAGKPEASEIVLGGYFALQFYADYRHTHDVDAWWKTRAHPATERVIREAMRILAAEENAELRERRFGETISFELAREGATFFSFQIAARSIALEEPMASAWPPILIETLNDNLASKLNALVYRGAPRDFTATSPTSSTSPTKTSSRPRGPGISDLWSRKNPGEPLDAAKQKVLLHLTNLEGRGPLDSISDEAERERARATREWFKREFLKR